MCYNNLWKYRYSLWGRVQFPTGGIAREPLWHDTVRFRGRQYSLDEKRLVCTLFLCAFGLLKSFFLQQPFLFDIGCSVYLIF